MPVSQYMPDITVEIAFDSTPDDPAPVWTDVSEWVEAAAPITITRGRSDELSEIQPSRLTVTLDNSDGQFTPGNTASPYYPNVRKNRRIRVSADPIGSTVRRRFTGYVDEWPVTWPDGTDTNARVTITASSRLARLAAGSELRSIIEEEYLLDSPVAYYPLGEAQPGAARPGQAGDVSGNQQPNLVATGDGFITWQDATGPGTDDMSAPTFHNNGRYLRRVDGALVDGGVAGGFTLEAFFNTTHNDVASMVTLAHSRDTYTEIWLDGTFGDLLVESRVDGALVYDLGSGVTVNDGETHHVVIREAVAGGGGLNLTATLFVDGVEVDTTSAASGADGFFEHRRLLVGNRVDAGGNPADGWVGSISHVAVTTDYSASFAEALSDARIARHADAGLTGFEGDDGTARFDRLAEYADISDGLVTGPAPLLTLIAQHTDGKTVLELMQEVADTEGGVLFDDRDGILTLHGRRFRYNDVVDFTLDASLQQIESSIEARLDGQQLVNDITATRAGGDLQIRVTDDDSILEHGVHRDSIESYAASDDDVVDAANWRINRYGEPGVRVHSVGVDLINSSATLIGDLLDAEISDRITLANLPDQAPATTLQVIVEGITETIGAESYTIAFDVSPAAVYDVWKLDTAGRSELDDTTVLAY